jgi:RND family efflux transporter MFP subunit
MRKRSVTSPHSVATLSRTGAALLALGALAFVAACGQGEGDKAKAQDGKAQAAKTDDKGKAKAKGRTPQAVSVAPVELQAFTPRLVVAGQVQPVQEARVFPTASGARVLQLLADAGDRVRAGQPLARLDSQQVSADSELLAAQVRRARTALAEAETGLTAARQNLARTQSGPKESALDTRQAEVALRQAEDEFQRAESLKGDGALSVEAIEGRRAQRDAAAARLRAQQGDAAALVQGRQQAVAQAQARVEAARADLSVAIAQQSQTELRQRGGVVSAPVGGLITSRNVAVGEIAGASGQPMFTIVANDLLEVAAEVPEADLGKLSLGMQARFRAPDGTEVLGALRRQPAQIDPQRRTGIARFTLEPTRAVTSGVFLTGEATSANRGVLAIPASSLLYGREGASVFVLQNDQTVRRVPVIVGQRQGALVELVSGPAQGALVVTAGGAFLAEGEKVNAIRNDPTKAAAPAAPASPAPAPAPQK